MPPRTRLVALLAPVLPALLGVAVTPAHAADARPSLGQCHQLTNAQVDASTEPSPAVPCTARHNTQTIAVVDVPGLASLTDEEFGLAGDAACEAAFFRAIGQPLATAKLTAYTFVYFEPTADQLAAGQSWVRCDLAVNGGSRLGQLPRHRLTAPVLRTKAIPAAVARCLKAAPPRSLDAGSYYVTTCSRRHDLRAVSAVRVPGRGKVRPGQPAFLKAARRGCPKDWAWATWPSEAGWHSGDHLLVCYVEG